MENTSSKKGIYYAIGAIVVIVVIVLIAVSSGSQAPATSEMASSTATSTPTLTGSSSTSTASLPSTIIYRVATDKMSYSQNDSFTVLVTIINNTAESKTFNFPNGCEGNYIIGSFDLSQHIRCTPDATSFTIPAQGEKTVKLVHYPTVYKIPMGVYSLKAEIVGYGGSTVPITITK